MRGRASWLTRLLFRAPILLYRIGLGGLLGQRLLHLTHTGRKSGLPCEVVLEVVRHWKDSNTYVVASAWGEKADWYQNVQQTPEVWVTVGRLSCAATATVLPQAGRERALLGYAADHPILMRYLSKFMGFEPPSNENEIQEIAWQLPMVGIVPTIDVKPPFSG